MLVLTLRPTLSIRTIYNQHISMHKTLKIWTYITKIKKYQPTPQKYYLQFKLHTNKGKLLCYWMEEVKCLVSQIVYGRITAIFSRSSCNWPSRGGVVFVRPVLFHPTSLDGALNEGAFCFSFEDWTIFTKRLYIHMKPEI